MRDYDRRRVLVLLGGAVSLPLLSGGASAAAAADRFVMWRDPGCGCCLEWARRIEATFGRPLRIVPAPDMATIKAARGVPAELRSCHTAMIEGYAIEGHVPPA